MSSIAISRLFLIHAFLIASSRSCQSEDGEEDEGFRGLCGDGMRRTSSKLPHSTSHLAIATCPTCIGLNEPGYSATLFPIVFMYKFTGKIKEKVRIGFKQPLNCEL